MMIQKKILKGGGVLTILFWSVWSCNVSEDEAQQIAAGLRSLQSLAENQAKESAAGDLGEALPKESISLQDMEDLTLYDDFQFLPGDSCQTKQVGTGLLLSQTNSQDHFDTFQANYQDEDPIFGWAEVPKCFLCIQRKVKESPNFTSRLLENYNEEIPGFPIS